MNSNNIHIYCYRDDLIFRTTRELLDMGLCGYMYCLGFGWMTESKNFCDIYDDWIDGELTEEEAKQFIRDNYHEEPVNFYEPARSVDEWEKNHPSVETVKEKLGFSN